MALEPREIGQRIATARKARDWTQVVFAFNAGVSLSSVQRWEAGQLPPVRELVRVGKLLGIGEDEIMDAVTGPTEDRLDRIEALLEELVDLLGQVVGDGRNGAHPPPMSEAG